MKDKFLTFIIGFLVGAIIATSGFFIYSKMVKGDVSKSNMVQMNGNGQMNQPLNGNMENPPEKPNGDNSKEPPTKPDESSTNTNI